MPYSPTTTNHNSAIHPLASGVHGGGHSKPSCDREGERSCISGNRSNPPIPRAHLESAVEEKRRLIKQLYEARERIKQLEEAVGTRFQHVGFVDLTPKEKIVFGLLYRLPFVKKRVLLNELYARERAAHTNANSICGIYIFKLRKKLAPFGVTIENKHGIGWSMSATSKNRVQELLRGCP